MKLERKGQSTVEYLIIFAVIVAIVVGVATLVFKPNIENIFNRAAKRPSTIVTANMLPE